MTKGCRRVLYGFQQAENIDDRDALRTCCGQEDLRLVGGDGDAPGESIVTVEFVQRDLNGSSHVFAKQSERIAKGPAVFDMCERNEILGPKLRGHAQVSVRR